MKGADFILELIFKGLLQWLFDMIINITEYLANSLLTIFTMDLSYFESSVPITGDIVNIMVGVGWALLLGNLVFQATKSMMTGLGFEGESPQTLFGRTFVMGFLLIGSRQVCDIGLSITKKVINMLQVPTVVQVPQLTESTFAVPGDASWLLVIIIGIILTVQIVKLFFEIGERYVIVAILTILSPLAFAMGGSKSTSDIFKGWVRMFASMCLMMVLSVVFLKFLLSAMSVVPTGVAVVPWCIFVVAIARTGRKIDGIIARIGLNPAITGDPLGHSRMPGMLSYMVMKNMVGSVGKTASANKAGGSGASRPAPSSGASSGGGTTPVRPPIGSSGGSASKGGTTTPAPVSGGHTAPGTAKPADTAAHRDSSHIPMMTPGREAGGTGATTTTGTHGTGSSGKSATRPPIAAPASAEKSSAAKPAATGTHGATTSEKTTPARPSAEGSHKTASTDKSRPVTARPDATSARGTAAAEKIPSAKPVSASPHSSTATDKPITARPSTTGSPSAKEVSSSGGRSAAHTLESSTTTAAAAKGHSTDAPKAATPIATRPTADIKSADTAKGGATADTSAKTGIPPASAAKAGMPLTDKIRPAASSTDKTAGGIASRGESVKATKAALSDAGKSTRPSSSAAETRKSARPARPLTGTASAAGTRNAAGTPKPSGGSAKSSAESRPSDASVINKAGDVNQKGGNVSQSQTNATNVTLQQKAVTPKRHSPEVTTARGEHSRPPVGKIPNAPKTSGAGSSKPPASEESRTSVQSIGDTVQNKGVTEQAARGSAKESYRNASTRPDSKATQKNETAKTSGTTGQSVKNAGANVSVKTTGAASSTNNAGVTSTTLSQSGISTSKPPSASHGAPNRANTATRPNAANTLSAKTDTGKAAQGKPAQTNTNNNTAHLSGKSHKQPQTSTGINDENKEKLKSRPPYKPSGDKPDGKKGG